MVRIDRHNQIACRHTRRSLIHNMMLLILSLFLPHVQSFGNNIILHGHPSLLRNARSVTLQKFDNKIIQRSIISYLLAAESSNTNDVSIEEYLEAAKEKLLWETLKEKEQRPVLNLSARNLSPEEVSTKEEERSNDDSSCWKSGAIWKATQTQLFEVGLFSSAKDGSKLLQSAPQLLRLDTSMVTETSKVLLEEFKIPAPILLKDSSKLLTYPPDDVRYGVEFLSLMMAMPADLVVQTCRVTPALLMGGVEGGLNEQAVKRALGAAADATSSANKRIAVDAAATLNQLRNKNTPKGLQ